MAKVVVEVLFRGATAEKVYVIQNEHVTEKHAESIKQMITQSYRDNAAGYIVVGDNIVNMADTSCIRVKFTK